jgi:DNA-binding NarL/FixJ family response regulator
LVGTAASPRSGVGGGRPRDDDPDPRRRKRRRSRDAVKLLVADDHGLLIEGVRLALAEHPDMEIVAEATSGSQVLPLVGQTSPDIVLLGMPGMDGLTCLELIRRRHPEVKVVMLSGSQETEQIQAALKRGASAYIVKTLDPIELPAILRQVAATTSPSADSQVWGRQDVDEDRTALEQGLTRSEIAILKAVARGVSNQQIADELWVTEQTVKFHLTNIYRKLNVKNRTEATRFAYQHGLVEPPSPRR